MSANMAEQVTAAEGAAGAQLFVINLCASTSPMALTHPSTPELKRFTFFVTRQREDGRERFRLHMGYFTSQQAAEALLASVRDVYPAAWAGPAPSSAIAPRRLRPEAVAATLVAPAPAPRPDVPVAATPPPAAQPAAQPAAVKVPAVAAPAQPAVAPSAKVAPQAPATVPTLDAMSNVRNVLAQLSDSIPRATTPLPQASAPAATRPAIAPPPAAPAQVAAPTIRPAPVARPAAAPAAVTRPTVAPAAVAPPIVAPTPALPPTPSLNAAQTLAVLEPGSPLKSDAPFLPFGDETDEGQVRVVTPEDTQTLTDIRLDAQKNAPPCFAVQLVWSVTPIDITKQAHLAIFDAYTLYNVEGNRQGRRWYGLRLGFFSDPNSATQVAYYVRSDYPKVAVVPVATRERERADGGTRPATKARLGEHSAVLKPESQTAIEKQGLDGFELLKDDRPIPAKRDVGDAQSPAKTAARATIAAAMARANPNPGAKAGVATGKPTGKRVVVRPRPAPFKKTYAPGAATPLESTLEILGASTLTLDESQSRPTINDSAIRAPVKKPDNSATGRFVRLLGKLGGT